MAKAQQAKYPIVKGYRDQIENKYQWCIAAVPGEKWAKKLFPELRASQAVREFVRGIEGVDTVTLLYASKNAAENHALILQEYLQRAAGGATTA